MFEQAKTPSQSEVSRPEKEEPDTKTVFFAVSIKHGCHKNSNWNNFLCLHELTAIGQLSGHLCNAVLICSIHSKNNTKQGSALTSIE